MATPASSSAPPVPLLDLHAQHDALRPKLRELFDEFVASGRFVLGPYVESFEQALGSYTQTQHAVGFSSGTDALLAAMMAIGVGPGDEVIVPAFTFFATAGCVSRLGATPVFVDIDPGTFNLDPARAADAVTGRTKAIIPVHLYGQPAAMDEVMLLAQRRGLAVLEDAAQAIGAADAGRPAGSIGTVGCLSFYPTKNLSAMGDAGACVTRDEELAQRLRILRNHGQSGEYEHAYVGGNFRLDAIQAAILELKLTHLDGWTEQRRAIAARYDEALDGSSLLAPQVAAGKRHVYHQYTIRVPGGRREALRAHLGGRGIGHRVYYPLPLHLQPCFASLGYQKGELPESERAAAEVLSLPIYPGLSEAQQQRVIDALLQFDG